MQCVIHLHDAAYQAVLCCCQSGAHDVCGMECSLPGSAKAPSGQARCFAALALVPCRLPDMLCCVQCQVQSAMQPSRRCNGLVREP